MDSIIKYITYKFKIIKSLNFLVKNDNLDK